MSFTESIGSREHERAVQDRTKAAIALSGVSVNGGGRMACWRGSVVAADTKKADNASIRALLIPMPPKRTGRLA